MHKAIMCIQAKVMAAAVGGQFKEATIGQIILDDNEPHIVENMLSLLYRQSYDDGQALCSTQRTPLVHLSRIHCRPTGLIPQLRTLKMKLS